MKQMISSEKIKLVNKLVIFIFCLSLNVNLALAQQGPSLVAKDFFNLGCQLKNKNSANLQAFSDTFSSGVTDQEKQSMLFSFLINPCDGKLSIKEEIKNKNGFVTVIGEHESPRGKNQATLLLTNEKGGSWKVVSLGISGIKNSMRFPRDPGLTKGPQNKKSNKEKNETP